MKLEEMVHLIRQEWSDAMSDNGAIWARAFEALEKARKENPGLYEEALAYAYEHQLGRY